MNQNSSDIVIREKVSTKFAKGFWEIFLNIIIIIFLGFFVIMPFQIHGSSMEENYHNGEYILVNKISYLNFATHFEHWKKDDANFLQKFIGNTLSQIPLHIWDPNRGDVVVVRPEVAQTATYYLKRVIGIPGDTVRISNGRVAIKTPTATDFVEIHEPYLSEANASHTDMPLNVSQTDFLVPEGKYFVLGDNRANSSDSRNCFWFCEDSEGNHFISRGNVIGKLFLTFGHFDLFDDEKFPKLGTLSWSPAPRFFSTHSSATYPELH